MSGWILLLLLFCGGFRNDCGCGERGNDSCGCGKDGRDGRGRNDRNDRNDRNNDSCDCGPIPAAWSDRGCDGDSRNSGRTDFPSVGRGEVCGCEDKEQ